MDDVEGVGPVPGRGEGRRDVVFVQRDAGGGLHGGGREEGGADVDAVEVEVAAGELFAQAAEPCSYFFLWLAGSS